MLPKKARPPSSQSINSNKSNCESKAEGFSLFDNETERARKAFINDGSSQSGCDLFPKMGDRLQDNPEDENTNILEENSKYESNQFIKTNAASNCSGSNIKDLADGNINADHSASSFVQSTIIDGSDDNDDNLDTSILNRILDTVSAEKIDDSGRSRFFFRNLYEKYKGESIRYRDHDDKNLGNQPSDFEIYNNEVAQEEKIRKRLCTMKAERYSTPNHAHYLPILNIGDLDSGFIKAVDTSIDKPLRAKMNRRSSRWYNRLFSKADSVSGNPSNVGSRSPDNFTKYSGEQSSLKNMLVDSGTLKSSMRNNNLSPLEMHSYDLVNDFSEKRLADDRTSFALESNEESENISSIGFIVSNEEEVDYNFNVIGERGGSNKYSDLPEGRKSAGSWFNFRQYFPHHRTKLCTIFESLNPLNKVREQMNHHYQIQRKLKLRHLHQIALGGTLGVGLLLSSGKAFSIAGPLGCLLGFIIAGIIVLSTMLSFCEMVTLIPLCGGVSGVSARFVDDAFGFALGVSYWFSYMIGMPTEITAASIMLSFYSNLNIPGPQTAAWISLFLIFATFVNLCDIKVYGEFEYYSTVIKLLFILALMIYMVVLNCGGSSPFHKKIGFHYWNSADSDLSHFITFGPFRPTFDVNDNGLGSLDGIGGAKGRLCQVITATAVAAYAYVGTEIVIIAGSEARNPRRAIPSATRNIYWRILFFYILSIFVVGLNIYSGDPRLLRYFSGGSYKANESLQNYVIDNVGGNVCTTHLLTWAGFSNGNQSPFIIAIQSAGMCTFAAVANAFLLYFAVTAATSQLYASSRTLYFMSIQGKAPKIFSVCTKNGVPYASVLFTALFGSLAYLSVNHNTALVFERLLSICSSTGLLVWSGMCLSFIRFFYGLSLRPDIINRDDENYPYKSPFQPYLAYFGMIAGFSIVILSGFLVFLRGSWSSANFISSYGSLFLFILCYVVYKVFRRTKIHRLDQLDLDSGRREIDRIIWEDEQNYVSNFKEIIHKGIDLLL